MSDFYEGDLIRQLGLVTLNFGAGQRLDGFRRRQSLSGGDHCHMLVSILQLKLRNPNTADHESTRQQKQQRQRMQSVPHDINGTHPKVRPDGVLGSGKC